ncbi:Carbohydrate esterase family 4 protein [Mycena sanguinolenta]|uniref:chitin deacetylase n=1 Tax=Mycena sanguinolenta TaxID=230812 RepID=A0A8H6XME0_9AGAR|nr:Carbohydrate esterase family 4 protein [Mycena sanguinolenta]
MEMEIIFMTGHAPLVSRRFSLFTLSSTHLHPAAPYTLGRATTPSETTKMRSTLLLSSVAALLLGSRADPTSAEENALTDPTAECAPYNYQPVTDAMNAGQFPPASTPVAGILANDAAGKAKFDSFSANIPNIQPKGVNGVIDTTIMSSYAPTDSDCWWTFSLCTTPKLSGLKPDWDIVPEPRSLGYGFDDGPNCSHNAFYDYMQQMKQKATVFYIGTNIVYEPLQAMRAAQDGHEICVHTWSHHPMTAFTNEQVFGELWYTMQMIKLVTGPPQGDVDDRVRYIAQQLGLQNILWKYDSNDWRVAAGEATPDQVQANYDYLIANVSAGTFNSAGTIMLTHELDNYTMQTAIDNYPKTEGGIRPHCPGPYWNFAEYVSGQAASPPASSGGSSATGGGSSPSGTASGSKSSGTTGAQGAASGSSAGVSLRLPPHRRRLPGLRSPRQLSGPTLRIWIFSHTLLAYYIPYPGTFI